MKKLKRLTIFLLIIITMISVVFGVNKIVNAERYLGIGKI